MDQGTLALLVLGRLNRKMDLDLKGFLEHARCGVILVEVIHLFQN